MRLQGLQKENIALRTIEEQTGWKRPHAEMICQDHEVLLKIYDYSFDLDNGEFVQYFISRTGILIGREEKPEFAKWVLTSPGADHWLLTSPDYKYLNGAMVPFGRGREIDVKINRILKGQLQDCRDLFLKEKGEIS